MPSSKPPKKRTKLTVELIDEMIEAVSDDKGLDSPKWDRLMELMWGEADTEGTLLDLLILARVALEHINVVIVHGGPKDATESPARNDSNDSGPAAPTRS